MSRWGGRRRHCVASSDDVARAARDYIGRQYEGEESGAPGVTVDDVVVIALSAFLSMCREGKRCVGDEQVFTSSFYVVVHCTNLF